MAVRAVWAVLCLLVLSGCIADPAERPPLSARPVTLQVPESPEYAGIVVHGSLSVGKDAVHVAALARNEGDRTYRVETGCSTPWSEELFRGDRERVGLREPAAQCEAFMLTDFAPGDERPFNVDWDGRVWDEGLQDLVPAEPGEYTWALRFVAYNPASGDAQLKRFDLDFDVTVLEG